jgi:hypothetical protein
MLGGGNRDGIHVPDGVEQLAEIHVSARLGMFLAHLIEPVLRHIAQRHDVLLVGLFHGEPTAATAADDRDIQFVVQVLPAQECRRTEGHGARRQRGPPEETPAPHSSGG